MSNRPFYVGYLPVPRSVRQRYLWLTPLIVLLGLGAGFLLAGAQQGAGNGVWSPTAPITLRGIVTTNPYAVLHTTEGSSALLVMVGKRGAVPVVQPFAQSFVEVRGNPIRRGGMLVLELTGPEAITRANGTAPVPAIRAGAAVMLEGEIVDTKCFLGVMKPGSGKVHRACAALCLKGGVPPMLVTQAEAGATRYLLIGEDNEDLSASLAASAGVPVRVAGTVETRGPLPYLRLNNGAVPEPLTGADLAGYGPALTTADAGLCHHSTAVPHHNPALHNSAHHNPALHNPALHNSALHNVKHPEDPS